MKVDLELLTFFGVVLTLIISIFSIWDRVKPKFPKFSVNLEGGRLLVITNIGQKKGTILKIEINGTSIDEFSLDKRKLPLTIEEKGKIQYQILVNNSIPTPEICSLTIRIWFFKRVKTFSL